MFISKKGQGSIEIIIGIFFLIFFLYVFNIIAQDTVKTIEVNKIKEQEQEIVLSLSSFLYAGSNIYDDNKFNILDLNMTYKVPQINIASSKLSCIIVVQNLSIIAITRYNNQNISYLIPTQTPNTYYTPIIASCGSELVCVTDNNKIRCE